MAYLLTPSATLLHSRNILPPVLLQIPLASHQPFYRLPALLTQLGPSIILQRLFEKPRLPLPPAVLSDFRLLPLLLLKFLLQFGSL